MLFFFFFNQQCLNIIHAVRKGEKRSIHFAFSLISMHLTEARTPSAHRDQQAGQTMRCWQTYSEGKTLTLMSLRLQRLYSDSNLFMVLKIVALLSKITSLQLVLPSDRGREVASLYSSHLSCFWCFAVFRSPCCDPMLDALRLVSGGGPPLGFTLSNSVLQTQLQQASLHWRKRVKPSSSSHFTSGSIKFPVHKKIRT